MNRVQQRALRRMLRDIGRTLLQYVGAACAFAAFGAFAQWVGWEVVVPSTLGIVALVMVVKIAIDMYNRYVQEELRKETSVHDKYVTELRDEQEDSKPEDRPWT